MQILVEEINRNFLVELMDLLGRYNASIDSIFDPMDESIVLKVYGDNIKFTKELTKETILKKLNEKK